MSLYRNMCSPRGSSARHLIGLQTRDLLHDSTVCGSAMQIRYTRAKSQASSLLTNKLHDVFLRNFVWQYIKSSCNGSEIVLDLLYDGLTIVISIIRCKLGIPKDREVSPPWNNWCTIQWCDVNKREYRYQSCKHQT